MKLLLHSCCGPCTVHPLAVLREEGFQLYGYFYNPNIHPFKEFKERYKSYRLLCEKTGLEAEIHKEYGLETYLAALYGSGTPLEERCGLCYRLRLEAACARAAELGYGAYSTTLLVSPYQNHELIRRLGEEIGRTRGVEFIYRDFRPGFRQAQEKAREMGLYMQGYCGCIFSEYDRYGPKKKKALADSPREERKE
ncbi:MAG: epoxyqueuosine reductase QueH [Peptococcaceae bacterium]|nr:epoxyqueuosine reductase QueH [Peptococcaceae bacterium]